MRQGLLRNPYRGTGLTVSQPTTAREAELRHPLARNDRRRCTRGGRPAVKAQARILAGQGEALHMTLGARPQG